MRKVCTFFQYQQLRPVFSSDSPYLNTMPLVDGALYWSFDALNTTGDNKYANQDVNSTQYNADPGLVKLHRYAVSGNSTRTRKNGTTDCLNFGDFTGNCVSDPNTCTQGLSLSLWIRLTEDEIKESGPVYIMSSGNLYRGIQGMCRSALWGWILCKTGV